MSVQAKKHQEVTKDGRRPTVVPPYVQNSLLDVELAILAVHGLVLVAIFTGTLPPGPKVRSDYKASTCSHQYQLEGLQ